MTNNFFRDCELEVLVFHLISLILLLIFFSRWIPTKKHRRFMAAFRKNAFFTLIDIISGASFLTLLIISSSLIISPRGHLSSLAYETPSLQMSGVVEAVDPKDYIWPVDYGYEDQFAAFIQVDKEVFFSHSARGVKEGDIISFSYFPNSHYMTKVAVVSTSSAYASDSAVKWYCVFARFGMLMSGGYLFIRLFFEAGREAEQKREELQKQVFPFADTPPQNRIRRKPKK